MPSRYNPFSSFGFSLTDDDQEVQPGQVSSNPSTQLQTPTPQDDSLERLANSFQPGPVNMHLPPLETIGPVGERAKAIYGETAGFRPQLLDPTKSPDNPSNWEPESAKALADTRTMVGAMYGRNQKMRSATPQDWNNPIEKREWNNALTAAVSSLDYNLDPMLSNMYHRQEGASVAPPDPSTLKDWQGLTPIRQSGPYYNVGGVSDENILKGKGIAKGPKAYIDWYGRMK